MMLSPPSRVAWIEISYRNPTEEYRNGRRPHGWRGLKSGEEYDDAEIGEVAALTGGVD